MILSLPILFLFPQLMLPVFIFSAVTVVSWAVTGDCILRVWEVNIRRKHDPNGAYEGMFMTYYTNKYLGTKLTDSQVRKIINPYMTLVLITSIAKLIL